MPSGNSYLRLGADVYLKELEFPSVYNTSCDEIYLVDPDGFQELGRCDGTLERNDSRFPAEFLEFCVEEGILELLSGPEFREVRIGRNETPSLRYLMVEITDRCNLSCAHCYLGETVGVDLPVEIMEPLLQEFESMGGLRLVVTGGEPTLHPDFDRINSLAAGRAFRTILVTNATLLDDRAASALAFQEIQVSLDGMRKGHDFIRGNGSFSRTLSGIDLLRSAGKSVSIATMVHKKNLKELDSLESLVNKLEAVSWTLDVPCEAGRLSGEAAKLLPDFREAAEQLERSFGSEQHQPSGDYACGAHLAFIKANGLLVKCGFYDEWSGGPVSEGLRQAWLRLPRMRLAELDCRCEHLADCGGGCRFRAQTTGSRTGPDPLKCIQFGVDS
jgi:radical SAM protein with 4Fe4S-binding SPASM domain